MEDATTVTAADLLAGPGDPRSAQIVKIASFTAPDGPLPNWRDHLALWAEPRQPGALPLDQCVVDLRAPELEPDRLVDRAGLAKAAALAPEDLPHPKYGRERLPVPQAETADGSRWSKPVALDWAEQHRRAHGPQELLSGTTAFGTPQPLGLVADHDALTEIIRNGLEEEGERKQRRGLGRGRANPEDAAAQLAWWPAVALSDSTESFVPISAVRTTLIQAIVGGFAEDTERASNKTNVSLGDLSKDVVKLLDWYILREPNLTPALFGEICLLARIRLDLEPSDVGDVLRRFLHLDSKLDGKTVNALLDLVLPPSALRAEEL
ncbi:hypothetical protein ACFRAI_43070 [Streptomyces sp. NPDC056637]|uniref:hypothetical protein n=1 Tax=unclassified Streptomyces TaxID=2593676 RepID=UPI003628E8AE